MKELNTFLQICIYISVALILFTLCVNFVSALDVFQTTVETGIVITGSSDNIFSELTGLDGGMEFVWSIVLTITGVLSVGAAILMHSAIPIGAYLFSAVFWTSYNRCISVVNVPVSEGVLLFSTEPLSLFLMIISVGILFLWGAAIVGIFTGSG